MVVKNLDEIFRAITDHWSPRIVGRLNGMDIKAVKFQGNFIWHSHPETDELFYIHQGHPVIRLPDGDISLGPGEFYVVPRGVAHKPGSVDECHALLMEAAGTLNTGDMTNDLTTAGTPLVD